MKEKIMSNEWAAITGAPGYEVSRSGSIRNAKSGIELTQRITLGYAYVAIQVGGKSVKKRVHRLVAEAFIPNPEGKDEVNHIDGNKLNNSVENLEWCTTSENLIHSYKTGLRNINTSEANKKRRRKVVRDDGVSFQSVTEAAHSLHVTISQMSKILRGARKSHDGHGYQYAD